MSREGLSIPPILLFADPERGAWGVAAGERSILAAGAAAIDSPAQSARMEVEDPSGARLRGEAGDLAISSGPPAITGPDGQTDLSLVRVAGSLLGAEAADGGGLRFPGRPPAKIDSVRLVYANFSPARSLALLAVRPTRARGQDRDEMSVACLGERDGVSAFDPRLSSTYDGEGWLRRVGIELWLGEDEEADLYSLRMAGEATGVTATLEIDGAVVRAQPFACHSRGDAGVGVYLLITPA